ncbi:uncharacterized protein LOC114368096 [Glycine soja]|uniref:uncharacterized protein LOC114368096 n=1 Tax=Glycine soja TaxID=3848 RepID=UPI0003DED348|nr:uncharacterized protein LOC114368096 [Glycine soja]|eukprot:XP_006588027.1 uncharacterized protein LOC102662662 [Glycine max]
MEECKPTATPMNQKEKFCKEDEAKRVDERLYKSLIRCLMYLIATRPDIMYAMSLLSRYMHCASEIHFQAAKRILRYVKGTIDYGIRFSQVKSFNLLGYSDSDWAGCVDDKRSTSVFHGRTKHFKIKFFFLREVQKDGEVQLVHCRIEYHNADILTKALPKNIFEFFRKRLGICSFSVKEEC